MNIEVIADTLASAFGSEIWPAPLRRHTGDKKYLRSLLRKQVSFDKGGFKTERTVRILGSLILGEAAERVFELLYRSKLSTAEIRLVDQRERRNDTDFRLINGQGRHLYRLNIKFHGAQFRNAKDFVGLDPKDCFPLATYKIKSALDKQDQEHLPYLFVVVTGSSISADDVGKILPEHLIAAVHYGKLIITTGKRLLEERIVRRFIEVEPQRFDGIVEAIRRADWYVFSARRAEVTMKELLFERVFALRTRAFNQAFRNAEIDMHLSFSNDMTRLEDFLDLVATEGHFRLAGMLERGTI